MSQVERPESLENVEAKWIPEVQYYCAGVKVILVGKHRPSTQGIFLTTPFREQH